MRKDAGIRALVLGEIEIAGKSYFTHGSVPGTAQLTLRMGKTAVLQDILGSVLIFMSCLFLGSVWHSDYELLMF